MILITGITGKTGKWFLNRLLQEYEHVKDLKFRAIIRDFKKIETFDIGKLSLEYMYGDLNDRSFVNKAMKDVDTVLHIAGISKSLLIVQEAVSNNVKRLILVHTTGIYSKYKSASADYLAIEESIKKTTLNKNINTTILRPTMIYGSLVDKNMIVFIRMVNSLKVFPVVNGANYFLQPVNERDLGNAYYQVLINEKKTINKNYILSGAKPILLIDIFKTIETQLGRKNIYISVPFPIAYFGAILVFILSFGRIDFREKVQRLIEPRFFEHEDAKTDFGFNPMSFEDGIKSEIEEFKKVNNDNNY